MVTTCPEIPPLLKVEGLTRNFAKIAAVSDISFQIDEPQAVGLLGLNGAGKSTLMRLITGFIPADRGTVVINGHDLATERTAALSCIGYLPENAPVFNEMRVEEALNFTAEIHGITGSAQKKAVEEAIERCKLGEVRRRIARQLSKGYRHRLGLAQAFIHHPQLLILDEPTDGLDPVQKEDTRVLIRELGRHSAVLISSHLLDEVPAMCSRVLFIAHGQLAYDGPLPENLHTAFQNACG